MNYWELVVMEEGDRVAQAAAEELARSALLRRKLRQWAAALAVRVTPKGVNVDRTEVRRRRAKNKRAKKARRRNRG